MHDTIRFIDDVNVHCWPRVCDNSVFAFSYLIRLHQLPCKIEKIHIIYLN